MEYMAKAYVLICGGVIDYASGWCASEETARAELQRVIDRNLPAGLYSMSVALNMRRAE